MDTKFFKIRQSFALTQMLAQIIAPLKLYPLVEVDTAHQKATGSTLQLLLILIKEFTETGSGEIQIPLGRFLRLRGIHDEKYARKQLCADLKVLQEIQFAYYTGTVSKPKGRQYGRLLSSCGGVSNSVIYATLDDSFLPLLPVNQFMYLPEEVLMTKHNENLPARLLLTWRICQHKRINLDRTNADVISVGSLLDVCPAIPSPAELGQARQISKRIINPFENAIYNCTAFEVIYCGDSPESYTALLQRRIQIIWKDNPYADSNALKKAKSSRRVGDRNRRSGG